MSGVRRSRRAIPVDYASLWIRGSLGFAGVALGVAYVASYMFCAALAVDGRVEMRWRKSSVSVVVKEATEQACSLSCCVGWRIRPL